jgi:hypothetical protein
VDGEVELVGYVRRGKAVGGGGDVGGQDHRQDWFAVWTGPIFGLSFHDRRLRCHSLVYSQSAQFAVGLAQGLPPVRQEVWQLQFRLKLGAVACVQGGSTLTNQAFASCEQSKSSSGPFGSFTSSKSSVRPSAGPVSIIAMAKACSSEYRNDTRSIKVGCAATMALWMLLHIPWMLPFKVTLHYWIAFWRRQSCR